MKRPFTKKTASIKNEASKNVIGWVKSVQINSEKLAEVARQSKQRLKSNKDVENPETIKKLAKELLGSSENSILPKIENVAHSLIQLSGWLRMHNTALKISEVVRAIRAIPINEQPKFPFIDDEE